MLDLQLLEDMELIKILVPGQTLLDHNLKHKKLGLYLDLHHLVLLAKEMEQQLALLLSLLLLLLGFDLDLALGLDLEHPNLGHEGHNHEHEHHNLYHDHKKQLLHQGSWLTVTVVAVSPIIL